MVLTIYLVIEKHLLPELRDSEQNLPLKKENLLNLDQQII